MVDLEQRRIFEDRHTSVNFTIMEDGVTQELFGVTVTWALLNLLEDQVVLTKAASVVDPANGRCRVDLMPDDTRGLKGSFRQEAKLLDAQGHEATVYNLGVMVIETSSID